MKKYIIFGVSQFLSDVIECIHANDGKVSKIYLNMPETGKERTLSYQQRLDLLDYEVEVIEGFDAFKPEDGCAYVLGTPTVYKNLIVEGVKKDRDITFASLIHPTANLASTVHVGEGVFVNMSATIGPNVRLEDFCTVNRAASIGHDSKVGRYSLIGPAAAIAGSTMIGKRSIVSMRATVLDRLVIGDLSVIGAAALVNKDIPSGVVAYGVPAKVVRENKERTFKFFE